MNKTKRFLSVLLMMVMMLMTVPIMGISLKASAADFNPTWPVDASIGVNCGWYGYDGHKGTDFAASTGNSIYAAESGYITVHNYGCDGSHYSGSKKCSKGSSCGTLSAGIGSYGGWGNYAEIKHNDTFKTLYAHMISFCVVNGSYVKKGQKIGEMGQCGYTTGPHLHFEVYKSGTRVNPEIYLTSDKRVNDYHFSGDTSTHKRDTNYATNFTAYPKRKISGSEIYYSDHTMYSASAWIGTTDKCTIHEVYTDGCCKVSYPGSGGKTVTMYSKYEYFVHTHVYTERYESAHPHKIYNQCECNHYYYTGATKTLSTCAECQKPSNVKLTPDTNSTLHIGQTITLESSASNVDSYKITIQLSGKNVVSTNCGRFYYFKCTSAGTYTAYTTATNSNGSVSSSKITFKVVDHSFDKVVSSTAATCSSTGKTVYACSGILAYNSEKCNATKTVSTEKNTSNHTGGTTVKNKTTATCTKEGYTGDTYCNGCNAKISTGKTIAKISHSYSVTKTIPPTCTEDGYTSYTCKTCGAVKKDNYVSAIGHYDNDSDGYCDYCDTDLGTHNPSDDCSHMCHKGGFSGFIWKMLNIFNKMFKTNKICECGANHY